MIQAQAHPAAAIETLEKLKRKLLDLSKRNRLLNYKATRASTVALVGERPVDVFQMLSRGETMLFGAAEENGGEPADADLIDVDDAGDLPPAEEYAPGAKGEPQHTDRVLQTSLLRDKLDHVLRRLADQSRQVEEDTGVSTLFLTLGMLNYYESEASEEMRRAPLLLLPVTLDRRSARAHWELTARDEEPMLNASLAEYLRVTLALSLPELPDTADSLDIDSLFAAIQVTIRGQPRWRVTNEIVLGLFSFQKFVMYKDMERNRDAFLGHRLFRQLATGASAGELGMPDEIRTLDLDAGFPPESTYQVVDADSSQQRALAGVAHGLDLVIEGPPGTGKSQTITNLIAQALAGGKSVLFVAEKIAALSVVHQRLKRVGLAPFCLEAHSTKGNKRAVIAEIANALNASLSGDAGSETSGARLAVVRTSLSGYAEAVHAAVNPLGWSPFRGYGERAAVDRACEIPWQGDAMAVTMNDLDTARRALVDLSASAEACGDLSSHPWRDADKDLLTAEERRRISDVLSQLAEHFSLLALETERAVEGSGLPAPQTLGDAAAASEVAEVIAQSPGAAAGVLTSTFWNAPPAGALEIIEHGRHAARLERSLRPRLDAAVLKSAPEAGIAVVEQLGPRWYRMLSADYRRTRRQWISWRRSGWRPSMGEQLAAMRSLVAWRGERDWLATANSTAMALFGVHWHGAESDWDDLDRYVQWVVRYRAACLRHRLSERAANLASEPHPDVTSLKRVGEQAQVLQSLWSELRQLLDWPPGYWNDRTLHDQIERVSAMRGALDRLAAWMTYIVARRTVAATVAGEILPLVESGSLAPLDLEDVFLRAFLQKWLDGVVANRPALRSFHGLTHDKRVEEFRNLDQLVLRENQRAIAAMIRGRTQEQLAALRDDPGWLFLASQLPRQRGHAPLRTTFRKAYAAIRAIKPCFLMSPLSVAQFLEPERHRFDLVIFDEASQLTPEDAVGAVVRAQQLVVVGDPKQLPPTNFFAVQSGQQEAPSTDDGGPQFDDLESILEHCQAAGVRKARLRWHYRSRHESLIAFSNANFYDWELFTFPSPDTNTKARGLQYTFVPDGVYEGAGLNRAEARAVADAVVAFAAEHPSGSLAVGTFNLRQQIAVQDEIERRRRLDPSLESFFTARPDGFFVRNLENIQGDERDVILLSVTYGKGPDGVLRHNFGPISGKNGARRLNVLVTRARERLQVFASMHGDEIDLRRISSDGGARFLREFLLYAESGHLTSTIVDAAASLESPFEREVHAELTRRGLELVPQVGVSGYRIDLAVADPEVPGRFVCGIECDGAAYHTAETARDRDRLRQQVLERLGWRIVRVWSTDWFKDSGAQVQRLLEYIETARQQARTKSIPDRGNDPLPRPNLSVESETSQGVLLVRSEPVSFAPYQRYSGPPRSSEGVMQTFWSDLHSAIIDVVETEGPLHWTDLASRVASLFGDQRVGSRINARLEAAGEQVLRKGRIRRIGEYVYRLTNEVQPRNRAGTGVPGERIAPEEYKAAILAVLGDGAMPRERLVTALRAAFGYNRTGHLLEQAIDRAIESVLTDGVIGQGSGGLQRRGK